MFHWLAFIVLGLFAGILSGLIGIGGGVIIVPALVLIFGMSQQLAQGTTLALLIPPIGILAVMTYYRQGYVDFKVAGLIIIGFVLGGLWGAKIATAIPTPVLERIFGAVLLLISLKMLFFR